ncbi:hypothetical protein SHIRM173S_00033 [Streptomyces hirsutus]
MQTPAGRAAGPGRSRGQGGGTGEPGPPAAAATSPAHPDRRLRTTTRAPRPCRPRRRPAAGPAVTATRSPRPPSGPAAAGGGGGEFGPPGSGDVTGFIQTDGFDYDEGDFVKPRKNRRWLKRSFFSLLTLAVIGGGVYSGWRWTQTQYYVGTNGEHVALYQGISQDLAWVSLSKVEKDHPEIELKYPPPYQRKLVEATIADGDLHGARSKIDELAVQASACRKEAERRTAESKNSAKTGEGEAGGTTGTTPASFTSKASPTPTPSGSTEAPQKSTPPSAPTPSPGPSLSEEEQKVVSLCGKQ